MSYGGPLKKLHIPRGQESLEVRCLRDGSLDCDLETGDVFSVRGDVRKKRRPGPDKDGYLAINLNREKEKKLGKPEIERRGKERIKRYRHRRFVMVHRLVKIKALAVAKGASQWRQYVTDLPRGVDVDHLDRNRSNNRADNLALKTELANRSNREMTEEEWQELLDALG